MSAPQSAPRQHRHAPSVAALLLASTAFCTTAGAQTYQVTDLGTGTDQSANATGLNNAGEAVGITITLPAHGQAFSWSSGTMTKLSTLGGAAQAVAINTTGQIAGASYTDKTDTIQHAVLWTGGVINDLGTLGAQPSAANGVNDSGQVVGSSGVSGSAAFHAFFWSGGPMIDLGTLTGSNLVSTAVAINSSGVIVGNSTTNAAGETHATAWQKGAGGNYAITDLYPTVGINSAAAAINGAGVIVGTINSSAAIWNNGTSSMLAGTSASSALAINSAGHVVGTSNAGITAVLFIDGNAIDLNTLLDPSTPNLQYISLYDATAINDNGQIIANGFYCVPPGCTDPSTGPTHAFLLTPEPNNLSVTPTSLNFGNETAGKTSTAQPVTVQNNGTTAFAFNPFTLAADYSQTNNCGASLAAGASCAIQVTFTPTAVGSRPATLSVASGFSNYTVNLSGNGTPAVSITASSSSVTAGNPVTLNWTATSGSSCTASGGVSGDGWTGNLAASGSQAVTESAAGQVTYVLTCAGGGQNAQAQVMVTVNAPTGGGGGGGGNGGGGGGGAFDLLSLLGLVGLASAKLRRKGFGSAVGSPLA